MLYQPTLLLQRAGGEGQIKELLILLIAGMLSRYGFEFDTYDGIYWDYISENPSVIGFDGHLSPVYQVGNGIIRMTDLSILNVGKYGYSNSSTAIDGTRTYFAIAPYKITAGVTADNFFGVSLRS